MKEKFIKFCKECTDYAVFPIVIIAVVALSTDFPVAVDATLIGIQLFLLTCQIIGMDIKRRERRNNFF